MKTIMTTNTGRFVQRKGESDVEAGYRESQENDKIDSKYGFDRVKDNKERTGYLINMHSVSEKNSLHWKNNCSKQKLNRPTFWTRIVV